MAVENFLRARTPFGRTAVYVPKEIPQEEIPWPKLQPAPQPPSKPSLLTYLPMLLLSVVMPLGSSWATGQPLNGRMLLVSLMTAFLMGGLFPAIQWWGYRRQKEAYQRQKQQRVNAFREGLARMHQKAAMLAQQHRQVLEDRYPSTAQVLRIALEPRYRRKRLWTREIDDEDFLVLRFGRGAAERTFTFAPPPSFSHEDEELERLAQELVRQWDRVPDLPITLPLPQTGSFLLRGPSSLVYPVLNRLIIDIAVHHSPRLVQIGVIARDRQHGERHWSWLKWLPHTGILEHHWPPLLAFSPDEGRRLLEHLTRRLSQDKDALHPETTRGRYPAVVLLLDEDSLLRRAPNVVQLVKRGKEAGIYLIFIGGTVHGLRAQVRLSKPDRCKAEWQVTQQNETKSVRWEGRVETLPRDQAEKVARALAALDPPEPRASTALLPPLVPLAEFLGRVYKEILEGNQDQGDQTEADHDPGSVLGPETVKTLWTWFDQAMEAYRSHGPEALIQRMHRFLHLPIGLTIQGGELKPLYLNLLPTDLDGPGSFHTILIGPTGSGKSEFLKSLIWGAAYQYPPTLLNIFFIDFKAGAALNDLMVNVPHQTHDTQPRLLPHLVGMVTNAQSQDPTLNPDAVALRGIQSLQREIRRRQDLITVRGRANDIWEYNRHKEAIDPSLPVLPHLLVIMDEYEEALRRFPELEDLLDQLGRIGRSLGMYLILANQKYVRMSKIEPNVDWRIALRMGGTPLKDFLGKPNLPAMTQRGRGYLLLRPKEEEDFPFQAAYGGVSLYRGLEEKEKFEIYRLGPLGRESPPLYQGTFKTEPNTEAKDRGPAPAEKQGRYLTQSLYHLAQEHKAWSPPRPVYLEPLPQHPPLSNLLHRYLGERPGKSLAFDGTAWKASSAPAADLEAPFGLIDNFQEVRHDVLTHAFHRGVGHLWILGVADSGKEDGIEALLLSLAHLYTPEALWIYILDFSSGHRLRPLAGLPHVGAHVLASERERLHRLVALWHGEFERRRRQTRAHHRRWLLVLHHYHRREVTEMEEEELHTLVEQLIQSGGRLGLHLLLTSLQVTALRDEVAANLRPRLIMEMGTREAFFDAGLPRTQIVQFTRRIPGRGFWLETLGQEGREAQVAAWEGREARIQRMDETWQGTRPPALEAMPACLPWEEWVARWAQTPASDLAFPVPVGLSYDMEPLWVSFDPEPLPWLVVGPVKSGKTHTLLMWARGAQQRAQPWAVWYLARKAPPPDWLPPSPHESWHQVVESEVEAWSNTWESVLQAMEEADSSTPILLLVDDAEDVLAACPQAMGERLLQGLQKGRFVWALAVRSQNTFNTLVNALGYGHPLLALLRQATEARKGLITRPEESALNLYSLVFRRLPRTWQWAWQEAPLGRSLLLAEDKTALVQVPYLGSCSSPPS